MQKNKDYFGYVPHYTKILNLLIIEKMNYFHFLIYYRWWCISVGKEFSLCGMPVIRKTPQSIITIGDRCRILSRFESNSVGISRKSMFRTLRPGAILSLGNDCGLSGVVISCAQSITIGNRVMIGANCTITDSDAHSINYKERYPKYYGLQKDGWNENVGIANIIIEDDVFIGMNSIILKGVTIGKGSVIGAGSVVSKSVPSNVIAAGNPAKIIKYL